jgi:hypothetical protein
MQAKLVFVALVFSLFLTQGSFASQEPEVDEGSVYRPDKQEIIDWMIVTARLTETQRNDRLETILTRGSRSGMDTARSDFLFCLGLAYRGDALARHSVARAYETGSGIVEDDMEAYLWFTLSFDGAVADSEAGQQRMKSRLISVYPSPSDHDLEMEVAARRRQIAQYQAEAGE